MDSERFEDLYPEQAVGDALIIRIVEALESAGTELEIETTGGVGPRQALVIGKVDGRRMRITAEPW